MNPIKIQKGLFPAVLSAMFYGTAPVLALLTMRDGVSGSTLLFGRGAVCFAVLLIYIIRKDLLGKLLNKGSVKYLLLGGTVYTLQAMLYLGSLNLNTASLATMLFCMYPVYVPILAQLSGKERFSIRTPFILAATMCGLWMLMNVDGTDVSAKGILIGAAAGFTYALYIFLGDIMDRAGTPPSALIKAMLLMTGVSITMGISGMLTGTLSFAISVIGFLGILAMAFCCAIIPLILFWKAVAEIGASEASLIGILEPVTASVLSVIFLHEKLNLMQIIGALIVIVSIACSQIFALSDNVTGRNGGCPDAD